MEYNKILEASQSNVYSAANSRASMGQPPMGQPSMNQPSMNQPSMGQPPMGQPSMNQPPMGQPSMGQPPMGQPPMNNQPSFWYQPMRPMPPMNNRPPMGIQPYPMFPSNMPMPFYFGQPMGEEMFWNESALTEEDLDRELEQIMEMYPSRAKEIQRKVMELCDSIDYEGSIIYDEYPDRFVLSRYCDKLYSEMMPEAMEENVEMESVESQDVSEARRQPCRNCRRNDGGRDLIDVLFFNEMFRRRRRKRRPHRW